MTLATPDQIARAREVRNAWRAARQHHDRLADLIAQALADEAAAERARTIAECAKIASNHTAWMVERDIRALGEKP
jgi:citrate lyase beta subunit